MITALVGLVPPWVADAACGRPGIDPEMFFPPPGKTGLDDTKDVREFCRHCPVVQACAEYAIRNEIDHGIWGGLTDRSRRKINGRAGQRRYQAHLRGEAS